MSVVRTGDTLTPVSVTSSIWLLPMNIVTVVVPSGP